MHPNNWVALIKSDQKMKVELGCRKLTFDGALDEATFCPWWKLQQAFGDLGIEFSIRSENINKESFTVELGSQEQIDLDVALEDAKSILSYLQYKGVINTTEYRPSEMTRYACYLKDYKAFYSPMGGMVDYLAEFGKPLPAGEPLARILRMDNPVMVILFIMCHLIRK